MLKIPYVGSSENACALACYTMTAKYFFPKTTFKQIAEISDWKPGYIVWSFKFWLWIMDKGIKITEYDRLSLQKWVDEGVEGLKKSVPKQELDYYVKNSKDLRGLIDDIRKVMRHKNFTHHARNPKFGDLTKALKENKVCEVVFNSRALNNREGLVLHRVVVLDVNNDAVVFHDPRSEPRPYRKENIAHFTKSWLEETSEPELCIYSK